METLCGGSTSHTGEIFTDQVISSKARPRWPSTTWEVKILWCADALPFQELMTRNRMSYTLTKGKCHSILQRHAIPSGLKWSGKGVIFQQDNGPKHAATLCQVCLKSREEQRVPTCCTTFPSQSPDVSLTKHLGEYLKRQKVKATVTSQVSHWDMLRKTAWKKCGLTYFSKTCRTHTSQNGSCDRGSR